MNPTFIAPHLVEGDNARTDRIKVYNQLPSFYDGRQFRSYKRLSISGNSTYVIKAVLSKDIILYDQTISLTAGALDLTAFLGGTEGGSFSETLPIIPKNQMAGTPAPAAGLVLTAGGTHTGGTERDSFLISTASAGGQTFSVAALVADARGLPAGTTFYLKFTNTGVGTLTGTWAAWAEQTP